ncbi:MAG: SRPBCC family protein [Acidimicrobiales bacterium]|nr:SRPBCC family protein [Acidimicrobiales bacterium]
MGRVRVSTIIDAAPGVVWEEVRHIDRHVDWMADAASIAFTSRRRSGVGTTFDCVTKVGPIRLTDAMEITDWREGKVIGVRHVGVVTGAGRFTITKVRGGRTRFTWDERLRFPWWLGGPVGAVVGGRVLKRIWRRNLRVLKALVESGRA